MVVATGTAMLIGGAASAAASAYGSHKAEKAAAKAKAKNMESLAAARGARDGQARGRRTP